MTTGVPNYRCWSWVRRTRSWASPRRCTTWSTSWTTSAPPSCSPSSPSWSSSSSPPRRARGWAVSHSSQECSGIDSRGHTVLCLVNWLVDALCSSKIKKVIKNMHWITITLNTILNYLRYLHLTVALPVMNCKGRYRYRYLFRYLPICKISYQ